MSDAKMLHRDRLAGIFFEQRVGNTPDELYNLELSAVRGGYSTMPIAGLSKKRIRLFLRKHDTEMIRPSNEQAARREQVSLTTTPQSHDKHLARRRLGTPSEHNEAVCAITHEKVDLFPRDDIYVTSTGVHYHKPSLKLWLQGSDVMPHTNLSSVKDLRRLWPDVSEPATTIVSSREDVVDSQAELRFEAIAFGALGLLSLYVAYKNISNLDATLEDIRRLANQACEFDGAQNSERYNQCVATTVPSLLALGKFFRRRDYAVAALALSAFVGLIGRIVHTSRVYEQKKLSLVALQNARAMTPEEIKKADMGIEYYQANLC